MAEQALRPARRRARGRRGRRAPVRESARDFRRAAARGGRCACSPRPMRRGATSGGTLAGYLAYEAGLALEPRLAPLAAPRTGADGPLVWFGLFDAADDHPRRRSAARGWPKRRRGRPTPRSARSTRKSRPAPTSRRSPRCRKRSARATSTRRTSTLPLAGTGARRSAGALRGDPPGGAGGLWRGGLRRIALAAVVQPRAVLRAQGRRGQGQADEGHAPARARPPPRTRAGRPSWPHRSRTRPRT